MKYLQSQRRQNILVLVSAHTWVDVPERSESSADQRALSCRWCCCLLLVLSPRLPPLLISIRSQLAQLNTDLETLQKRLSVQQRSAEADMGLLRARTAAAQRELVGALDGERAMTAAGVHLGVLRAECVPRLHARACK